MVANDRNRVLNLTWRRRWIRRFCDFAGALDPIESELARLLRNLVDHRPLVPPIRPRLSPVASSTMNSLVDLLISSPSRTIDPNIERVHASDPFVGELFVGKFWRGALQT